MFGVFEDLAEGHPAQHLLDRKAQVPIVTDLYPPCHNAAFEGQPRAVDDGACGHSSVPWVDAAPTQCGDAQTVSDAARALASSVLA